MWWACQWFNTDSIWSPKYLHNLAKASVLAALPIYDGIVCSSSKNVTRHKGLHTTRRQKKNFFGPGRLEQGETDVQGGIWQARRTGRHMHFRRNEFQMYMCSRVPLKETAQEPHRRLKTNFLPSLHSSPDFCMQHIHTAALKPCIYSYPLHCDLTKARRTVKKIGHLQPHLKYAVRLEEAQKCSASVPARI
jgi:hypothetical protein